MKLHEWKNDTKSMQKIKEHIIDGEEYIYFQKEASRVSPGKTQTHFVESTA
jgi:hypothetical protein